MKGGPAGTVGRRLEDGTWKALSGLEPVTVHFEHSQAPFAVGGGFRGARRHGADPG